MRVVICGGGAIGAAIAYFLSRRGARPIVIERNEVAGAASGKSGGFLALDWCRGSRARSAGAAQLRAACRARRRARQSLGLSAADDLCRLRGRERARRAAARRQAVAQRQRDDHRPDRLAADDGAGRAARLHPRPDARRRGAGRGAAARHGRRPGAPRERRVARRRARRRRDGRRRRGGDRHGTVVDPCRALAAAAGGVRLQGPQPGV